MAWSAAFSMSCERLAAIHDLGPREGARGGNRRDSTLQNPSRESAPDPTTGEAATIDQYRGDPGLRDRRRCLV